jgi:adenylosuccinate synthase
MKTLAIIGAQWGDEGKGKIADLLGEQCDYMVRYQGGNNAGHTIWVGKTKYVLHLIPSAALHEHVTGVIGHGVVVEPEALLAEIDFLNQQGKLLNPERLWLSENASVITTYHRLLDAARENHQLFKIGTTGKGIGPTYEDKYARRGLRVKDLLSPETLREKLALIAKEKEVLLTHLYHLECPSLENELERLLKLGEQLKPYIKPTASLLMDAAKNGKKILFEGAQGILLDIDYGTYPYVTSSSTGFGGIQNGALPGVATEHVLGIVKAYTTRVGEGPFPTELHDHVGTHIQTKGNEKGATTGRPRRCGWLDLPLLRYAINVSRLNSLALTKCDILTNMEQLKVCVAYEYEGKTLTTAYPGLDLAKVRPIYQELPPFHDDFTQSPVQAMSKELMSYLSFIESETGIPVSIMAYGPERSQVMMLRSFFTEESR